MLRGWGVDEQLFPGKRGGKHHYPLLVPPLDGEILGGESLDHVASGLCSRDLILERIPWWKFMSTQNLSK